MKADKKFTEYLNGIDKSRWSNSGLAIYYKYFGEAEKARQAFEEDAMQGLQFNSKIHPYVYETIIMPDGSRKLVPREMTEKEKQNIEMLIRTGESQLLDGIKYSLAHVKPEYARQLFEWAAENCILSDETLAAMVKYGGSVNFENIALAYLWRGYALLLLGQYDDAHKCLTQVNPYFTKSIKYGGKTSKTTEFRIPIALLPLSKYNVSPNEENKHEAVIGLEDFIDSFKDPGEKYEAFIYYYHLKDAFPDVYNVQLGPIDKKAKPSKKFNLPPSQDEIRGKIVVFDREGSGSLKVFGSVNELEEYVEKVANLGDYPTLSRLLEIYGLDEQQDPEPLIEECEKLLSVPGRGDEIREKTRYVLTVAGDAKRAGSTVMLYLDENL